MKNIMIIGAGQVGAHIAQQGIAKNLPANFHLLDINDELTHSQTLDLKDTLLFSDNTTINEIDFDSPHTSEMDVIVITAGANQEPGETRTNLLGKNAAILRSMQQRLGKLKPSAIIILVTNPVDIVTRLAQDIFDLPPSQILGTGTLLDSARLRWRISERLNVNINNVHGYVLGEHGDSEFVAWSTVSSADTIPADEREEIESSVRNQAYDIIQGKGATYFGIGAATVKLLNAILNDTREVIPASARYPHFKDAKLREIPIGIPSIINKHGIAHTPETKLDDAELAQLEESAKKLLGLYELVE